MAGLGIPEGGTAAAPLLTACSYLRASSLADAWAFMAAVFFISSSSCFNSREIVSGGCWLAVGCCAAETTGVGGVIVAEVIAGACAGAAGATLLGDDDRWNWAAAKLIKCSNWRRTVNLGEFFELGALPFDLGADCCGSTGTDFSITCCGILLVVGSTWGCSGTGFKTTEELGGGSDRFG